MLEIPPNFTRNPQCRSFMNTIYEDSTPEKFDELAGNFRFYRLEQGGYTCNLTALHVASQRNNLELIHHIVNNIGGKHLLDLGDRNGYTPIYYAMYNLKYRTTEELLKLGASVNIISFDDGSGFAGSYFWGIHPKNPLEFAAEHLNDLRFVKLLLRYGAIIPSFPREDGQQLISEQGQQLIRKAQEQIEQSRLLFCAHFHPDNSESPFYKDKFPKDLVQKIIYFTRM